MYYRQFEDSSYFERVADDKGRVTYVYAGQLKRERDERMKKLSLARRDEQKHAPDTIREMRKSAFLKRVAAERQAKADRKASKVAV